MIRMIRLLPEDGDRSCLHDEERSFSCFVAFNSNYV